MALDYSSSALAFTLCFNNSTFRTQGQSPNKTKSIDEIYIYLLFLQENKDNPAKRLDILNFRGTITAYEATGLHLLDVRWRPAFILAEKEGLGYDKA
ncbi:MAG: hypothetical protein NC452_13555 [Eubacterium sp.]|nr:hypothetical protein [Eubacterium sp.]